jgi:hypothetical protein
MSVNGRFAPLLLLGALAILLSILGGACGSATLKTDGGAGSAGVGGFAGRAGAVGGSGGSGGGAVGSPCVLDSTQVDNCILQ